MLAILGPGTLGRSLAQWGAECGVKTRLLGRTLKHAEAGLEEIYRRWDRAVAKGQLSLEARRLAQNNLGAAVFEPEALNDISTFLEALPEDETLKIPALSAVGRIENPNLLILSGTSSISITNLAKRSGLESRLVGFHLFMPVPKMAVVEMAVAPGTQQIWVNRTRALGQALHKRVVQVRDQPGFAAARMALAQGLEAMRLLEDGIASAEDLDALMTLGYGHPMGPLELSDRVGLGLRLTIAEGLTASGEARFQPPELLRKKVSEGATGVAACQGIYPWDQERRRL